MLAAMRGLFDAHELLTMNEPLRACGWFSRERIMSGPNLKYDHKDGTSAGHREQLMRRNSNIRVTTMGRGDDEVKAGVKAAALWP
jgi:hypothetical protein